MFTKFPESHKNQPQEVPKDYWSRIAQRLYTEKSKIPDPAEIKTEAKIKTFGLPSGSYSVMELPKTTKSMKRNRIIAEYLTNKPGIFIEGETMSEEKLQVLSMDFRDLYPDNLPQELNNFLDERTRKYIEIELEHLRKTKGKGINLTKKQIFLLAECTIHYFRLPGGVDLLYPQYAMKVVLRTIHHLVERRIKNIFQVYEIFRNPNLEEIIEQIAKVVFKKPEPAPEKPVQLVPNQRKLLDHQINFLKIYGIDPQKVIPSNEEIERIRQKLSNL